MGTPVKKPRATFGGAEKSKPPSVIERATIMQAAIVAALALSMFASAPPLTMAAFLLMIQAASAAQAATSAKTRGLVTARAAKIDVLWTAMNTLKTWVQGLADASEPLAGAALIEAAGLVVQQVGFPLKPLLSAKFMPATGVVHLEVNATMLFGGKPSKKKTHFLWSWSTDGGKTWSAGVTTSYTHADIPSLPPASYLFRVQATVGKTVLDWSNSIDLVLH